MMISIVIVNWNVAQLLCDCIDSLKKYLADISYEIIVVDNASKDNSVAVVRDKYPEVVMIANSENQGFSKANNQGFAIAKGEYILILNPDTLIKDDSIQRMIKVLETDPKVGMVGPRIFDEAGVITPPCKRANLSLGYLFCKHFLLDKIYVLLINKVSLFRKQFEKTFYKSEPVDCIQGSCMVVRKVDLDKIGYFDETIPMYLDDRDLCYRFKKAGFIIYYCADAEIIHLCGASTKKSDKAKMYDIVAFKAADTFLLKHYSVFHVVIHRLFIIVSMIIWLIIDIIFLPFFIFFKKHFIFDVIKKHFYLFIYGITGYCVKDPFSGK